MPEATSLSAVDVHFYDGIHNQLQNAVLRPNATGDGLIIEYAGQRQQYHYEEMKFLPALGQVTPVIELPNEARIEFLSMQMPTWVKPSRQRIHQLYRFERSKTWIVASLLLIVMLSFGTIKWGIPIAAHYVAQMIPNSTLNGMSEQTVEMLKGMTEQTQLSSARQAHIRGLYEKYIDAKQPAKILFVKGGETVGSNALAIPNGTIILTDELIGLAKNDQELIGVLAHEQAHIDEKHSLEQVLRGLGMSIVYVAMTGDTSDILSTLPGLMITSQYSQEFETKADHAAIVQLKREQISPQHLANFLKALAIANDEDLSQEKGMLDWLSSHPRTQDRIAVLEQAAVP